MAKLSWTSWSTLRDCGHHFKLKYDDKIKTPDGEQKKYIVGRVAHEIMQLWVQAGYPTDPKFALGHIKPRLMASLKDPKTGPVSATEAAAMVPKIAAAITEAQKLYLLLQFPEHKVIYEMRYNVTLSDGQTRLWGAADTYDPVTKTMWDLKNYSSPRQGDWDQLMLYAVAFRRMNYPTERIGFLFPLLTVKQQTRTVSEEEITRFEQTLIAGGERAEAKAYGPPIEGSHCFWCPYNKTIHCPVTYRGGPQISGNRARFVDLKDL